MYLDNELIDETKDNINQKERVVKSRYYNEIEAFYHDCLTHRETGNLKMVIF